MMALSRAIATIAESRWLRSMLLEALNYQYTIKDNDEWEEHTHTPIVAIVHNKPLFDHTRAQPQQTRQTTCHWDVDCERRCPETQCECSLGCDLPNGWGYILTKIGVSPKLLTKVLDWGQFVWVQDASIRPERSTQKIILGVCDFSGLFLSCASWTSSEWPLALPQGPLLHRWSYLDGFVVSEDVSQVI